MQRYSDYFEKNEKSDLLDKLLQMPSIFLLDPFFKFNFNNGQTSFDNMMHLTAAIGAVLGLLAFSGPRIFVT